MRLIDADLLCHEMLEEYGIDGGTDDVSKIYGMVINAPTIETEPVVRCKECRYASDFDEYHFLDCKVNRHKVMITDYCSYGERRAP